MSATLKMEAALKQCLVPLTTKELSVIGGIRSNYVAAYLKRKVESGSVRRVGHGKYEAADRRTLASATDIEVKRDVRPVVPSAQKTELRPQNSRGTVSLLLEVIARSDDPKPYAGVLREISETLATA